MHPLAKARFIAELVEGSKRTARITKCPRCVADILVGDDHDTAAVVARVNLDELTPAEEMLAIFTGLSTYDLVKATGKTATRGTFHLYRRETWHHDTDPHPVVAEHRCERTTRRDDPELPPMLW